jgi:hypothetical protein
MNYGINLNNPILNRNRVSVGALERAALKMSVDGTFVVLEDAQRGTRKERS